MRTRDNGFTIRAYRPGDRQALRDICVATGWMGEYRPELLGDDWIWAEFWTRYFTDICPRWCYVVEGPAELPRVQHLHTLPLTGTEPCGRGNVQGYLMGTPDVRRFNSYAMRLMPGIVWRVIRKRLMRKAGSRRALLAMLRTMLAGEMDVPSDLIARYPATCHLDMLPPARGCGFGRTLLQRFIADLSSANVPGVHGQTLSLNANAQSMLRRAGFTLACRRPTRAFAHVIDHPVEIVTFVRSL